MRVMKLGFAYNTVWGFLLTSIALLFVSAFLGGLAIGILLSVGLYTWYLKNFLATIDINKSKSFSLLLEKVIFPMALLLLSITVLNLSFYLCYLINDGLIKYLYYMNSWFLAQLLPLIPAIQNNVLAAYSRNVEVGNLFELYLGTYFLFIHSLILPFIFNFIKLGYFAASLDKRDANLFSTLLFIMLFGLVYYLYISANSLDTRITKDWLGYNSSINNRYLYIVSLYISILAFIMPFFMILIGNKFTGVKEV
jgi:hypothetical protein